MQEIKLNDDLTLKVENCTEYDFTDEQIKDAFIKRNPVIYWNDADDYHFLMDFKIFESKNVWFESTRINNELTEICGNLYL